MFGIEGEVGQWSMKRGRTYVAMRADGLGERLRAVTNAMVLAELLRGEFAFKWRTMSPADQRFHDVLPAPEMFTGAFLNDHLRPELDEEVLPLASKVTEILNGDPGSGEFIRIDQNAFSSELKSARSIFDLEGRFGRAFAGIRFTPFLEEARRLAATADLPAHVPALHFRAGDIVYGRFRFTGRYAGKIYPYPLVIRVVEDCLRRGVRPIVFGQDPRFRAWLKEKFDIYEAVDFLQGRALAKPQMALFEIGLMARCTGIYAGSSGFASLAASISDQRIVRPQDLFTPGERLRIIDECLSVGPSDPRISDLQRAIAAWAAIELSGSILDLKGRLERSDLALRYDPTNVAYALHSASMLYQLDRDDEAEQRIARQLEQGTEEANVFFNQMRARPFKGIVVASPYMDTFKLAASKGNPLASFCLSLASKALGHEQLAREHAILFANLRAQGLAHLDETVLSLLPGAASSSNET